MYTKLVDDTFRFQAQQLEDLEIQRKSVSNRIRIATRPVDVPDKKDGICRGKGLDETHPSVKAARDLEAMLIKSEKEFKNILVKTFEKTSPLAVIVKDNYGIGAPMVAKLLGIIGDPYIKPASTNIVTGEIEPERVRTLSELFSYCGMTPDGRRKKGNTCKYSPNAQSALWNMAEAIKKNSNDGTSPLKDFWTERKDYYLTRVDDKGKPWNGHHAMAAAHRKVGREILKKLYFEAEKLHTSE